MSVSAYIDQKIGGMGYSSTFTAAVSGDKMISVSDTAASGVSTTYFETGSIPQNNLKLFFISSDQTIGFSGSGAVMGPVTVTSGNPYLWYSGVSHPVNPFSGAIVSGIGVNYSANATPANITIKIIC
jgi:hypothetical protein